MRNRWRWLAATWTVALVAWNPSAPALDIPIAGLEVPELALVEQAMLDVMESEKIGAGMLAVMRHGVPIYHRSFGWRDEARTEPLPIDSMMRLASITKPLTAAAIRSLVRPGVFSLSDKVFDTTGNGNGLLDHVPFGTPDPRVNDMTVLHLLRHQGGWDRGVAGDHTYRERQIASEMGLTSPPGRDATMRWILGKPLQFAPGTDSAYSNIGYMALGLISEKLTGKPHIEVLRERVFGPMGVDPNDVIHGRTFAADQDPREPFYDGSPFATNVFFPTHSNDRFVDRPYGGWDQEARIGQGAVVATPLAILEFLDHYQVAGNNIGGPRPAPGNWRWSHSGGFSGTSTMATQRGDGINFVIMFNKSDTAGELNTRLNDIFGSGQIRNWPTFDVTTPPPSLLGDFNGDWIVDAADYVVWRNSLGANVVRWSGADASGNGKIDVDDYLLWKLHFGDTSPATLQGGIAVPEPGSLGLVLAGLSLALVGRLLGRWFPEA